jgi:hypothetical protein
MVTVQPCVELTQITLRGILSDEYIRGMPLHTNLMADWQGAPSGARLRLMAGNNQLGEMLIGEQGREGLSYGRATINYSP